MEADIDGVTGKEKLGLIGFHFAIATALHPEMILASFEHLQNSARCDAPLEADQKWSFASTECIKKPSSCTPNEVVTVTEPTGQTPTEICTAHPFGTKKRRPKLR